MIVTEFAAKINNRKYGYNMFADVIGTAKQNGLVIVYGMSDDLMEFEGAINDEADVWNGGVVTFDKVGFTGRNRPGNSPKSITAVWHDKGNPSWTYSTAIPHSTFRIMKDGEAYCIGIVFSAEDLS